MPSMTEQIQARLNQHAQEDPVFAEKMRNPRKSFKNCMIYIGQRAQEYMMAHKEEFLINEEKFSGVQQQLCGDIDDEICFGWANHYYDEADLEIDMTDEERRAKREKEAAERKARNKEATNTQKPQFTVLSGNASETAPRAPKKPEEMTKEELRRGEDCYTLF